MRSGGTYRALSADELCQFGELVLDGFLPETCFNYTAFCKSLGVNCADHDFFRFSLEEGSPLSNEFGLTSLDLCNVLSNLLQPGSQHFNEYQTDFK